jgi:hypothetical protein
MFEPDLPDEALRRRLADVAARHADAAPPAGAARVRRVARRRSAVRSGVLATAVAVLAVAIPALVLGPGGLDRGAVAPVVSPPPTPTEAPEPTPVDTDPAPSTDPTGSPADPSTGPTTGGPSQPGPDPGDGLPGTPAEVSVPEAGAVLAVIGVERDDVLNVRALPGPGEQVVAEVAPTGEVVATGRARDLDGDRWVEVSTAGTTGWTSGRFLALGVGAVEDLTARVVTDHGGTPSAPSMARLAQIVADSLAGDGSAAAVTVAAGPDPGDLTEIVVDSLGLEDDSVLGHRLRVFAVAESGTFTLRTVEATPLCGRGVDGDGLCV